MLSGYGILLAIVGVRLDGILRKLCLHRRIPVKQLTNYNLYSATHDEDTRFGPAWITFAHCFAFEGEHESAITAYSTTARLFPGSYFPHLCIGMEHLQLNNAELAAEAFNVAYSICQTDPLLLNELGVSAYNRGL